LEFHTDAEVQMQKMPLKTISKIENNLHADPDFVKVMKTARKKRQMREICANA
jgi:hypothetical protein